MSDNWCRKSKFLYKKAVHKICFSSKTIKLIFCEPPTERVNRCKNHNTKLDALAECVAGFNCVSSAILQYLVVILVIVTVTVGIVQGSHSVLSTRIKGVHYNLLSAFDFGATERTSLKKCWVMKIIQWIIIVVFTCPSESTCHAVKQGVHSKCPHGSILISLSFSAQILQSWKVLPKISNDIKKLLITNLLWNYPFHSRVHIVLA